MRTYVLISITVICLAASCSTGDLSDAEQERIAMLRRQEQQRQAWETLQVSTDLMESAFTFGSETEDEEYLLAMPEGITVMENNDIVVFDEFKLKIFDREGKPKKIAGGRGEGPGEFKSFTTILVVPEGNITVMESSGLKSGFYYSVFDRNYNFVDKRRFIVTEALESFLRSEDIPMDYLHTVSSIAVLSANEMLYKI